MTRQLARPFLFFLAICMLALATPAQSKKKGGGRGEVPDMGESMEMAKRRKERAKQQEEMLARMTPEERLEHGTRRGSRSHCRFVATCRPPKLMPGQTGTLLISAILQGNSVLPAPSQVTMIKMPKETGVSTGDLFVRPATVGKLAKAYQGRPVYENTAIMELPVTMTNSATLGEKQQVAVDLKFDIYDGNSGQPVGRFIERISTNIEVGHYHEPKVAGRAAPKAPVEQAKPVEQPESTPPAVKSDAAANGAGEGGMTGQAAIPEEPDTQPQEAAAPAETEESSPLSMSTEEDGMPTFLLVGGGVILALIVLMLIRRK